VPRYSARSIRAPGDQKHLEDLRFRQALVVSVPITKVINTFVLWLRWLADNYVGHLGTKMTFLRSTHLNT
jgi:hypothetical protein